MRLVFSLFAFAALLGFGCSGQNGTERASPNVLLIVIDTLRADHLGVYGYPKNTSPEIDRFAERAILFEQAYAQSPMTVPSHASLFTSTYPAVHRAWNEPGPADGEDAPLPALAPSAVTLAEVLESAGYETAAFADGGWLQRSRGLAQGFSSWDSDYLGTADRVSRALEWIEARDAKRPFFLFVHTYEVHTPWLPEPEAVAAFSDGYDGPLLAVLEQALAHAESGAAENPIVDTHQRYFVPRLEGLTAEDLAFVRALYDAEIRSTDREIGRLLRTIEDRGLANDTWVILTSDHGEEFGEHGRFGHLQVYQESLHVPLLIQPPGLRAGRIERARVELVDVAPTLLSGLGLDRSPAMQGRVLDLSARAEDLGAAFPTWAEVNFPVPQIALRLGDTKTLLHGLDRERAEVFDLREDPSERRDLSRTPVGREAIAELRRRLPAWRNESQRHADTFELHPVPSDRDTFDRTLIDQLRALGYLQ